jgi:hypothetical protein
MKNRPTWYTNDHDSTWERVKGAFRNDWEQTKHDFGSKDARDLNQDVDDTLKQAAGAQESFENREQAFKFGHAAQRQYRSQHSTWNDDLDQTLRNDYGPDYDRDRQFIRHAYEYRYASTDRGNTQSDDLRDAR